MIQHMESRLFCSLVVAAVWRLLGLFQNLEVERGGRVKIDENWGVIDIYSKFELDLIKKLKT